MRSNVPVAAIALDPRAAGLDDVDCAVMELAERVVDDATSIGEDDLSFRVSEAADALSRSQFAALPSTFTSTPSCVSCPSDTKL